MNLPFILDVVIGLVFIYLILSLLASEIQEFITTIFQWRAEHLKQSIEILLSGGVVETTNDGSIPPSVKLANQLYDNPLIKNINQQAKGGIAVFFRSITWALAGLYRNIKNSHIFRKYTTRRESMFGDSKQSGPSYIRSETFATTLMETLQLSILSHKLSEIRLKKFKDERLLQEIDNTLSNFKDGHDETLQEKLAAEVTKLRQDLDNLIKDFVDKKASLTNTIDRMVEKLDIYISNSQAHFTTEEAEGRAFINTIKSLKTSIFGSNPEASITEKTVVIKGLKPTLTEIIAATKRGSAVYQEIEDAIQDKDSQTYKIIQDAIELLPASVRESLEVLAKRAEARVKNTEEDVNQLRKEIESWFDSSMERATGVYKRNAKGVAILIGLCLAIAANADSFHMVNRLSIDSDLHSAVVSSATQVVRNGDDISNVKQKVNQALRDISLPIGWTSNNVCSQIGLVAANQDKKIDLLTGPESICDSPPNQRIQQGWFLPIIKRVPGWLLSGLAISMGAPFWFDLLNKVVNVRNAGKPPASKRREAAADETNS